MDEDGETEPRQPGELKAAIARLALKLGGFDRVGELSLEQLRLLNKAMADEQIFLARINGCEIEGESNKTTTHEATWEDYQALALALGCDIALPEGLEL